MCVCLCVCVYIYPLYISIYIYTYTHIHIHIHICIYTFRGRGSYSLHCLMYIRIYRVYICIYRYDIQHTQPYDLGIIIIVVACRLKSMEKKNKKKENEKSCLVNTRGEKRPLRCLDSRSDEGDECWEKTNDSTLLRVLLRMTAGQQDREESFLGMRETLGFTIVFLLQRKKIKKIKRKWDTMENLTKRKIYRWYLQELARE